MKHLLPFLLCVFIVTAFLPELSSQSTFPRGFTYQAIARNTTGAAITNTDLKIKIAILSDTIANTVIWEEEHSLKTNAYGLISLIVGTGYRTGGSAGTFSVINWASSEMFIYVQMRNPVTAPYVPMGKARLWSVPYALLAARSEQDLSSPFLFNGDTVYLAKNMAIGSDKPHKAQLAIVSEDDASDDPLFEVRRKDGQPVFSVYNDAVTINVPFDGKKGSPSRGGFAIGGFDESKGTFVSDLFRVTPDSVRIYINNNPAQTKGSPSRGGFAIGGFDESKVNPQMFMNVTASSLVGTVPSTAQMVWYPKKEAFLAGRIKIAAPDSVGLNSTSLGYHSMAKGGWSQAFGYRSVAAGTYSTAIGKLALATMPNSFAFGNNARATSTDSYAFGSGAEASGSYSFAFGSVGFDDTGASTSTPTRASGQYSMALGMGALAGNKGSMALGVQTTASGYASTTLGYWSQALQQYSIAIGYKAVASGSYATAIGYQSTASGNYSASIGYATTASATTSFAFGASANASATNALAMGNGSTASAENATAIGYQSRAYGSRSTSIGSYYSTTIAIPIITLSKDEGTKDIDDFLPIRPLTPISTSNRTFTRYNTANGQYSIAVGNGNLAENGGAVFGSNSDATQFGAVALGTSATASERNAIAAGYNSSANGVYSVAIGNNLTASSFGEIALGQWNEYTAGTTDTWNENQLLFSLGNGVNSANRSNALTIYKNGKTIVRGRYAVTTFNNKRLQLTWDPITFSFVNKDYIYGVYTLIRRDDPAIEYYYSGYFADSGSEGTYRGLYADLINAYELNATFINGSPADVAEYIYDTNADTEPGDVVVADPSGKISVIKSSKTYQSSVLGIVSTEPMLTMGTDLIIDRSTGDALPDAKPATRLALAGRVPVKVTNENGTIIPGDMLTSSSTPGYAMKWSLLDVTMAKDFEEMKSIVAENDRRRNAIIGKALESHNGGKGKIMVLITL